jgi:hypothetical protein
MSDKKLEELVNQYAVLAKDDKIDTTALLFNALEQEDANRISSKTKRWAYLISISVPPFGLLFAIWFYIGDKSDGKSAAITCTLLTAFSCLMTFLLFKTILSGSGTSVEQIQQIKPADIYQLSQ